MSANVNGSRFEKRINTMLLQQHATVIPQKTIRVGGVDKRKKRPDFLVSNWNETVLVSVKWQESGGTAEEKVPFEFATLCGLVGQGLATRAILVLGGTDARKKTETSPRVTGWRFRHHFINYRMNIGVLPNSDRVEIITDDELHLRIYQGKFFNEPPSAPTASALPA